MHFKHVALARTVGEAFFSVFIIVLALLFAEMRLSDLSKETPSSVKWVHLFYISSICRCMKSDFTTYLSLETLSLLQQFEIAFDISTL